MGYYIETTKSGNPLGNLGKVQRLIADGAKMTSATFKPNLVCVINNGPFEAAAYIYSEDEFKEFNSSHRIKTWLEYDAAAKLSGFEG